MLTLKYHPVDFWNNLSCLLDFRLLRLIVQSEETNCSLTLGHCGPSILLTVRRAAAVPIPLACVELVFLNMLLDNVPMSSENTFNNRHGINCCTLINPVALAFEGPGALGAKQYLFPWVVEPKFLDVPIYNSILNEPTE